MKRIIIVLLMAVASVSLSYSQQIEIKKTFGENRFYQDGKRLYMKDVIALMENNQEALALMKQAKKNYNINMPIALAGGGLIGWNLGKLMVGGKPNWVSSGIGVVLTGISIKILSNTNKKSKQAVEIYNSSLIKDTSYQFQPEFKLITNERGVGLCVKF
ncbi:hypothetical protein [Capnocytophaga stomatis]|uniref:Uncharacterized protein n=1 Tax=Capnocytophaga stomatis TaxID=1848904 RepID=A0ABW8QBD6_9FLAO|nr:hypothetical protein [Capnocytophaga stomatis]